jgi:hypothetical protein
MKAIDQYRYILTVGALTRISTFNGVDNGKLTTERESGQIFYRTKYSGGGKFKDADFKLLKQAEQSLIRCDEAKLELQQACQDGYISLSKTAFGLTDLAFDYDSGTATLDQFITDDDYRTIYENWEKEYNILDVKTTLPLTARLDFRTNFEFAYFDTDQTIESLDDVDTWSLFLEAPYWIDGSFPQNGTRSNLNVAFRLVRDAPYTVSADYPNGAVTDLSADNWIVVKDDPANRKAKYAKQPNLYNFKPYQWGTKGEWTKYPDLIQVDCNTTYDPNQYIKVTGSNAVTSAECDSGCLNIRYSVDDLRCKDILWKYGTFSYNRNRRLIDVIFYLLQKTCPENCPATPEQISQFFTSATNYVTDRANKLIDIVIAQKSDIIEYKSSEVATKGMYSLQSLTEDLKKQFNVYWFINEDGKFQIEHLSYFKNAGVVDMTVDKYERYVRNTRNFTFDKTKMPQYERLVFSEGFNDDFLKGEIEYSGACINKLPGQNSAENTLSNICNDIQGLMINGGQNEGFVLMVHSNGVVLNEAGELTGKMLPNGHLAAANLLYNYHLHGRVLAAGLMNGKPQTFRSITKTKKQGVISYPYCCDDTIEPLAKFITTLSEDGELGNGEFFLKSSYMHLTVMHQGEPVDYQPVPARQFDRSFPKQFD